MYCPNFPIPAGFKGKKIYDVNNSQGSKVREIYDVNNSPVIAFQGIPFAPPGIYTSYCQRHQQKLYIFIAGGTFRAFLPPPGIYAIELQAVANAIHKNYKFLLLVERSGQSQMFLNLGDAINKSDHLSSLERRDQRSFVRPEQLSGSIRKATSASRIL
ncbi:hypothetical protein CEXT_674671 [Caerostris extrusa]|uniref:Uncharacterized protein n=1 Tax=Caerostris extrusa TaxID=172846 RepID=A0AAV4TJM1_CAEEX|nr:hypothetical protein CEXT_674671 [Caerostris extrusa]